MTHSTAVEHPVYNYKVVRQFTIMTVVWGLVGMLVGVVIAAQLAFPQLNFDLDVDPNPTGRGGRQ